MANPVHRIPVFCWILDDPTCALLVVDIDDDRTVGHLKEEIVKKKHVSLGNIVEADELTLWKVPVSRSEERGIDNEKLRSKRQDPLLPRMTLTELFSQPPLLADSYIVAELPDLRPSKRLRRSDSRTILPTVPTISPSNSNNRVSQTEQGGLEVWEDVADFHHTIWDKPDAHMDVFKLTRIERGDPRADVQIPDKCIIMRSKPFTTASMDLSGIFIRIIRNEYIQAVKDIVAYSKGGAFDDIPGDSDDMTDMTVTGDNPHQEVDTRMDTSVDVAVSSADPVTFPTHIENPFLHEDHGAAPTNRGVAISGSPGMGKSVLLDVLVTLRSLAGFATIVVTKQDEADMFSSSGAVRCRISDISKRQLLVSTWILVDSNSGLVDVPLSLLDFRLFIVQAASPRPECFKWEQKNIRVDIYFLKPWTVEEVLATRMLQEGRVVSETDLETFCTRYISSPRAAFKYASSLSRYESLLERRISSLGVNDIIATMKDWSTSSDSKSAHQIFILRPGTSRSIPHVQIATDFLAHKLFSALGSKIKDSAEELYPVFSQNKIMKGAAGALLNSMGEDRLVANA